MMASGDSDLNSIFWRYAKPEDNPRFMHMRETYIPQRRREERESWEASLQFMRAKNIVTSDTNEICKVDIQFAEQEPGDARSMGKASLLCPLYPLEIGNISATFPAGAGVLLPVIIQPGS